MSDTQQCAYNYTVKRGDSFYLIAQRTGVQLRDLLEANPGIPAARLMIGDVLCIPYCKTAEQPACEQNSGNSGNAGDSGGSGNSGNTGYTCPVNRQAVVQEGQTASDLQLRYNLSYHTLKTANAGKDIERLNGGDVVCIPPNNIACSLPATVTLGENDTLETVATRYKVPIAQVLRVNPCLAPQDFKAGATVRLSD